MILDTGVLIDVQRGFVPAVAWFANLQELPAVTGFTVLELIQDSRDKTEVEKALRLVEPFQIVWPQQIDCERAMVCFAKLHLSHRIGVLNVLIGFTALGLNAELCTFNSKHVKDVPGLRILRPYKK